MSLAHAFPEAIAQQSAKRQLVPGAIIKMIQKMSSGKVKEKWFVVIEVSASTVTCVINTDIPNLYANNPAVLACQIPLAPATHPFIHHPSHLDCSMVMPFPTANVVEQLTKKPAWFMGTADPQLLNDMVSALGKTPRLNKRDAARYTSSLLGLVPAAPAAQPEESIIVPS